MNPKYDSAAALHHYERGAINFHKTRYREAYADYRAAVGLAPLDDPSRAFYLLNLGNACQLIRSYDEAEDQYNQILANPYASPQAKASAQDELRKLAVRRSQGLIDLQADDQRLFDIVQPMLVDYSKLRKSVSLWWVNKNETSLARIAKMESKFNVELQKRITRIAWAALGHFPRRQQHFIFIVRDKWDEATDEELRGMLAHELTHEEWKEVGYTDVIPDPASSALAFVCNERITDLVTISKGYGQDLLASRRYQQRMEGSLDSSIMSPAEIERIIASELFLRQSAVWQMAFALELRQKIGQSPLAAEEWQKAVEGWEKVIAVNSTYAFAYLEQGTAYFYLDDLKNAEACYRKATELDPDNSQYKKKLEEVIKVAGSAI